MTERERDQLPATPERCPNCAYDYVCDEHMKGAPMSAVTDTMVEAALQAAFDCLKQRGEGPNIDTRRYWTDGDKAAVRAMLEAVLKPQSESVAPKDRHPICATDGCDLLIPRTPRSAVVASVTEDGFKNQIHSMLRQSQMLAEEGNDISSRVMADAAKMVADVWKDRERYRQGMANWKATAEAKDREYARSARTSITPLMEKVAKFADLKANWDSYGAEAFPERTITLAMEVAATLDEEWKCVPCADGPSVWLYRGNEEDIIEVRTTEQCSR